MRISGFTRTVWPIFTGLGNSKKHANKVVFFGEHAVKSGSLGRKRTFSCVRFALRELRATDPGAELVYLQHRLNNDARDWFRERFEEVDSSGGPVDLQCLQCRPAPKAVYELRQPRDLSYPLSCRIGVRTLPFGRARSYRICPRAGSSEALCAAVVGGKGSGGHRHQLLSLYRDDATRDEDSPGGSRIRRPPVMDRAREDRVGPDATQKSPCLRQLD